MTRTCRRYLPLEERAAVEYGKDVPFRAPSLFLRQLTSFLTCYRAVQWPCPGVYAETQASNG